MYLEKLEDLYMLNTDSMRKEIEILPVTELDMFMAIMENHHNIKGQILTDKEIKKRIEKSKSGKANIYYRGVPIKIIEA